MAGVKKTSLKKELAASTKSRPEKYIDAGYEAYKKYYMQTAAALKKKIEKRHPENPINTAMNPPSKRPKVPGEEYMTYKMLSKDEYIEEYNSVYKDYKYEIEVAKTRSGLGNINRDIARSQQFRMSEKQMQAAVDAYNTYYKQLFPDDKMKLKVSDFKYDPVKSTQWSEILEKYNKEWGARKVSQMIFGSP